MQSYHPSRPTAYRLALIGEGPSDEDKKEGEPFSGGSGQILTNITSKLGLPRTSLFMGYVSERRNSEYAPLSPTHPAVIRASDQLAADLAVYKPHCCLVMSEIANKVFGFEHPFYSGRGTIYHSPIFDVKCVATYDPGEVMRNFSWMFPFSSDIVKAVNQSMSPRMELTFRNIVAWPTYEQVIKNLQDVLTNLRPITFDLEGNPDNVGVTCYSIARSPTDIFIVPFRNVDDSPFWALEQEIEIWKLTDLILSNPNIRKTCQNGMYELFVFAWRHKILVRGLEDDTMYQMWELYPEQPKDLGFISSIYTTEPYYKSERTVPDLSVHHEYCCKDSAVTDESAQAMTLQLAKHEPSLRHYRFNISLQKPYLYMELRGCKLDQEKLLAKKEKTWSLIQRQQAVVNEMTNRVFNVKSSPQKMEYFYSDLSLPTQYVFKAGKKEPTADFSAICKLYTISQLPVILEIGKLIRLRTNFSDLNKLTAFPDGRIRSNFNPVGTDTGRLSSSATNVIDYVTLPKIQFKTRSKNKVKYQEMVLTPVSKFEKLGTNLQNITKDQRDVFIPDSPDFDFFQYDLSGADAWTVAADLAALGNDKMLTHLKHKIKPSVVILLLVEHGPSVYKWDFDQLKQAHDATLKTVKSVPRLARAYTCCKACQHGTNYGMESELMASIQLERTIEGWIDSVNEGTTDASEAVAFQSVSSHVMGQYQRQYINYYGLDLRNAWLETQLSNFGYIDAASGARRRFQNIRSRKRIDAATVRAAASHEPQANTTFATNSALVRMYYDLENRTKNGYLRCEPLIMVHDALAGQTHKSQRTWAEEKMNEWFNIPLIIHGIPITIPVEGSWGTNWKET